MISVPFIHIQDACLEDCIKRIIPETAKKFQVLSMGCFSQMLQLIESADQKNNKDLKEIFE